MKIATVIILFLLPFSPCFCQRVSGEKKIKYEIDIDKPLYLNGNGGPPDQLLYSSILSGYSPTVSGVLDVAPTHCIFVNAPLDVMLRYLLKSPPNRFGAENLYPFSRFELRVKDTLRYIGEINTVPQKQNYYTYQFTSKDSLSITRIKGIALNEIKRYFGIDLNFEKKKMLCLVLKTTDASKFSYRGGPVNNLIKADRVNVNNITVTEFIEVLLAFTKYHTIKYPFVDETGFDGILGEIQFKGDIFDYKEMAKGLKEFGLSLSLEQRTIEVLVVSDSQKEGKI